MKLPPQVCNALFSGKSVDKVRHLGSGRMGSVYKVTLNNGDILCVKVLTKDHPTKLQDSNGWKLAYDHLGFDFKFYEDNQYFYFTMPYFKGELLHCAIQFCLRSRLQIIQNLIKAADDIHRKGLIHRDLKCNNIVIDNDEVYIIDFGRSVNVFDPSTRKASAAIDQLQLTKQGIFLPNIRRGIQPFTAPEFYKASHDNFSTIGFRSDHFSIAQLFKFLVPEYSHLANKVIHTEGIDRNVTFAEFSSQIDGILMINESNPKFNESDKVYSNAYIFYKKIIFFITQTLDRLLNLIFHAPDPTFNKATAYNYPKNITPGFFKPKNLISSNLVDSLPSSALLCVDNRSSILNS